MLSRWSLRLMHQNRRWISYFAISSLLVLRVAVQIWGLCWRFESSFECCWNEKSTCPTETPLKREQWVISTVRSSGKHGRKFFCCVVDYKLSSLRLRWLKAIWCADLIRLRGGSDRLTSVCWWSNFKLGSSKNSTFCLMVNTFLNLSGQNEQIFLVPVWLPGNISPILIYPFKCRDLTPQFAPAL